MAMVEGIGSNPNNTVSGSSSEEEQKPHTHLSLVATERCISCFAGTTRGALAVGTLQLVPPPTAEAVTIAVTNLGLSFCKLYQCIIASALANDTLNSCCCRPALSGTFRA